METLKVLQWLSKLLITHFTLHVLEVKLIDGAFNTDLTDLTGAWL